VSPLFEIAFLLVPLDHVASRIVNANHGAVRAAEKLRVIDGILPGALFASGRVSSFD